jgi:hypothetical protein
MIVLSGRVSHFSTVVSHMVDDGTPENEPPYIWGTYSERETDD